MEQTISAIYERGVFKPQQPVELPEGQEVTLAVTALGPSPPEVQLREWQRVYEGLSEEDIAAVEAIALDRSRFFGPRGSEPAE